MLIFVYIRGLQSSDNMTWSCLVPRPLFYCGMEWYTKTNKLTTFRTAKQKSTWWQPQPRGAIFQVLATSTELAHKIELKFSYWHFVIPGVPTNIDTWYVICVAFNSTLRQKHRRLFPYVQSGCVTCSDDVGLPQASNVRQKSMCIIDGWIVFDGYPVRNCVCSWSVPGKMCSWFSSWKWRKCGKSASVETVTLKIYYIKNQQDETLAVLFISNCKNTLHVSDAFWVHHQEY